MKILPKTEKEALDLIYNILNQGDTRYNDFKNELILSDFLLNDAISLEEKEILCSKEPEKSDLEKIKGVQKIDKYLAKILLNKEGFKDVDIFFERSFLGSRPDVLAESTRKIIAVECCSCRIDKIIHYLSEIDEVWILTLGESPWVINPYLKDKMHWYIFRKGSNWELVLDFKKQQIKELKKVPSLLYPS
jgi:hypothetical protein